MTHSLERRSPGWMRRWLDLSSDGRVARACVTASSAAPSLLALGRKLFAIFRSIRVTAAPTTDWHNNCLAVGPMKPLLFVLTAISFLAQPCFAAGLRQDVQSSEAPNNRAIGVAKAAHSRRATGGLGMLAAPVASLTDDLIPLPSKRSPGWWRKARRPLVTGIQAAVVGALVDTPLVARGHGGPLEWLGIAGTVGFVGYEIAKDIAPEKVAKLHRSIGNLLLTQEKCLLRDAFGKRLEQLTAHVQSLPALEQAALAENLSRVQESARRLNNPIRFKRKLREAAKSAQNLRVLLQRYPVPNEAIARND